MRIGIDARLYGTKQGGLGRYLEQLIKHLEQIDNHNEYIIFLRKDNWHKFKPTKPNFKKIKANMPWYSWQEQLILPFIIKLQKIDLMHFPHWNVPLLYNKPFVLTIHDLIMHHYPRQQASTHGPLLYWFKDKLHRLVLNQAAKRAKQIIVPSKFTKQDINKTLGLPLNKITVTHLAPLTKPSNNSQDDNILQKYNINKPFVLYVGVAFPHKNLTTLLKAWKEFNKKYDNNYQLVLVGKQNYFYNQLLKSQLAKELDNLVYTDYLTDQELKQIYSNTSLYIFPSLYEGFGLPPLEAMQYKVPVASSKASCLPEILQDAAIYFDPKNIQEIVRAIHIGLHDKNLRQRLRNTAQKTLSQYSWEKTAKQTLDIYRKN